MLKFVIINKKKVPVPIPVKCLKDAVNWIESVLLMKDDSVTKIELDGKIIDYQLATGGTYGHLALNDNTKLEIQIDSPFELAIQTIDGVRNLCTIMKNSLRAIAVNAYKTKPNNSPPDLDVLRKDLVLILDLLDHMTLLVSDSGKSARCSALAEDISRIKVTLDMAFANSNWQGAANILLNKLENKLTETIDELSNLQRTLFEHQDDYRKSPRRNLTRRAAT